MTSVQSLETKFQNFINSCFKTDSYHEDVTKIKKFFIKPNNTLDNSTKASMIRMAGRVAVAAAAAFTALAMIKLAVVSAITSMLFVILAADVGLVGTAISAMICAVAAVALISKADLLSPAH